MKTCVRTRTYTHMFIETVFIIAKQGSHQMRIRWWLDEQIVVSIHAVEYYLAIKRTRLLIHTTLWINLSNVTLRRDSSIGLQMVWLCYMKFRKRLYRSGRKQISGFWGIEVAGRELTTKGYEWTYCSNRKWAVSWLCYTTVYFCKHLSNVTQRISEFYV